MATTKFYLDTRSRRADGTSPLKLAITHKGKTALLNLDVALLPATQWDARGVGKVVNHPNKQYVNSFITRRRADVEAIILRLTEAGEIVGLSAQAIKQRVLAELFPAPVAPDPVPDSSLLQARFQAFIDSKRGRTRELYESTLKKMQAYDPDLATRPMSAITFDWLVGFDAKLSETAPARNARNIDLRNVRAVYYAAMDDGLVSANPFRRFKIRPESTPKRSLSVAQLRQFMSVEVAPHLEKYRSAFLLIFALRGINVVDLCRLQALDGDRVNYRRAKTRRLYSLKVEPEALALVNELRGVGQLLYPLDRVKDYRRYAARLNKSLQEIAKAIPGFPRITTYWARHSWATIAASLDIPKETIAASLGHGGNSVTDIYIDFDLSKVDVANRKVLDWVWYGKK